MTTHHVPAELLLEYATGALPEGPVLAVSTHLSYCAACRAQLVRFEAVGGAFLESLEPSRLDSNLLDRTLARLDDEEDKEEDKDAVILDGETRRIVPPALQPYLGTTLRKAKWRHPTLHLREARLALQDRSHRASLLRIGAGRPVPRHTHGGAEYTVVLAGGFTDGGRAYRRGDFCMADPSVAHRPVAMEDGECLCLSILDAPVRPTGWLGRLVAPFLR